MKYTKGSLARKSKKNKEITITNRQRKSGILLIKKKRKSGIFCSCKQVNIQYNFSPIRLTQENVLSHQQGEHTVYDGKD
jgi:hypothetical protein